MSTVRYGKAWWQQGQPGFRWDAVRLMMGRLMEGLLSVQDPYQWRPIGNVTLQQHNYWCKMFIGETGTGTVQLIQLHSGEMVPKQYKFHRILGITCSTFKIISQYLYTHPLPPPGIILNLFTIWLIFKKVNGCSIRDEDSERTALVNCTTTARCNGSSLSTEHSRDPY